MVATTLDPNKRPRKARIEASGALEARQAPLRHGATRRVRRVEKTTALPGVATQRQRRFARSGLKGASPRKILAFGNEYAMFTAAAVVGRLVNRSRREEIFRASRVFAQFPVTLATGLFGPPSCLGGCFVRAPIGAQKRGKHVQEHLRGQPALQLHGRPTP
jgi:hypothetical protein